MRRVVITGLGVISPLGNTAESLWAGLEGRRSGVAAVANGHAGLAREFAGVAHDFTGHIDNFGPLDGELKKSIRKGLKVMCRESQMGVAAAQRALSDAAIAAGAYDPERVGVVFGSDYMVTDPTEFISAMRAFAPDEKHFEFSRWAGNGMPQLSPLWLLKYLPNMPASHIAIYNDFRGPNNSLTLREAAANLAVGEALRVIQRGHADCMLAGATGTRVHPMKALHAVIQEEIAPNGQLPERASRPFDLNRSGMVLGEGAGAIMLEEYNAARARGARIYAELVGAGSSSVVDRNRVARRDQALRNAMKSALRDAQMEPAAIGHVNSHGLGTRSGDAEEAAAIHDIFGARKVPVAAVKSYFGNLGAGSAMVELAASALALANNRLFPVLNYETPDPECPVAAVTNPDASPGDSFMKLSVTPQGQAACLIVRRCA
ncbi:MAG TPA: beta-ketoacyl-[acyl-carrier-protein] synthase family protein [Pirellulales bacterium]|nr:beta-ketoacyl-[acyl-carrier-protein] synthase family protein [Pirellulales bacterium]